MLGEALALPFPPAIGAQVVGLVPFILPPLALCLVLDYTVLPLPEREREECHLNYCFLSSKSTDFNSPVKELLENYKKSLVYDCT